jgi:pyrroloquinoline-quinone synthase
MKRVPHTVKCETQAGKLRMMEWISTCNFHMKDILLSESEFIAGFQAIGEERYHHKHPFHLLMHEGKLTRGQLQSWALNRYYYQSRIPIKDAALLARTEDSDFRRIWRKRIIDHDGDGTRPGGIEKWLRLVEATGLSPQEAISGEGILPATRYAVQAYVDFVSTRTFLEAVASSLTELFSGKLIALRMDALRKHYPWLSSGLDYFTGRLTQAPEDAEFALAWVVKHARTREEQDNAHGALRAKCDILWAQLDALYFAYVNPGWPPPGAFKPAASAQEVNRP